jgi:hypothetical protein
MMINEEVLYPNSLEKNAAAFLIFSCPISTYSFLPGVVSIPATQPIRVPYLEKQPEPVFPPPTP